MSDEIKEILFLLHNDRLTESGKRKLEDYITNLQEELKSIKENYKIQLEYDKDLEKRFNSLLEAHKICDELEQEKQERIDKAIEYITSEKSINIFKTIESREEWLKVNKDLLNILQGSDKE